jgi:hypothetical protein
MEINITCLLQMLHFLVGWYILDRLYFRPALMWLTGQERQIHVLHTQIGNIDRTLATLHEQEQKHKQQFMDYCKEHTVAVQQTPLVILSREHMAVTPSAISAQESARLEQQLTQQIIQKVRA